VIHLNDKPTDQLQRVILCHFRPYTAEPDWWVGLTIYETIYRWDWLLITGKTNHRWDDWSQVSMDIGQSYRLRWCCITMKSSNNGTFHKSKLIK